MLVKESSDLTLQLSSVFQFQLTHGTRMFKKFALDFGGKIVPLHEDCGAEAPQNMLLFVSEGYQFIARDEDLRPADRCGSSGRGGRVFAHLRRLLRADMPIKNKTVAVSQSN
jgi:hypothetical protein